MDALNQIKLIRKWEEICEAIRIEKEKLLQAEMNERFGQSFTTGPSLLTEKKLELKKFADSLMRKDLEIVAYNYIFVLKRIQQKFTSEKNENLRLRVMEERKEWEQFILSSDHPLPTPHDIIYAIDKLHRQLIKREIPKIQEDKLSWHLPIDLKNFPIFIVDSNQYAFQLWNQYYSYIRNFWINSQFDFSFPEKLEWIESTSNPDHGVYLHNAKINYSDKNFRIIGNCEEHEPYHIQDKIIKNEFSVEWTHKNEFNKINFVLYDGDLSKNEKVIDLPYFSIEVEESLQRELFNLISYWSFY